MEMEHLVSKSTFKAEPLEVKPRDNEDPAEALRTLRGSVIRYDDPLEPVGLEDWTTKTSRTASSSPKS